MNTIRKASGTQTILALVFALVGLGLLAGTARAANSQKKLFDRSELQVATGNAAINSGTADYTTWQPLVTITPDPQTGYESFTAAFDLAQTTTGFSTIYSSATIQFAIQRKVDGTNWRTDNATITTAISGTNSAGMAVGLTPGIVGPGESLRLACKVSSMAGSIATIPYVIYYRGAVVVAVTPAS